MTSQKPPHLPREHERRPMLLPVEFRGPNGITEAATLNISRGGMFVETKAPLPDGTVTFFRIRIGESSMQFHLEGRVVWSKRQRRRTRKGPSNGMGVRFLASRGQTHTVLNNIFSVIESLPTEMVH